MDVIKIRHFDQNMTSIQQENMIIALLSYKIGSYYFEVTTRGGSEKRRGGGKTQQTKT